MSIKGRSRRTPKRPIVGRLSVSSATRRGAFWPMETASCRLAESMGEALTHKRNNHA